MAWFRKNDGSTERKELDRLHRQQAAEGGEPLPEESQRFLDKALESLLKSPGYIYHGRRLRGRRSRLIDDYVSKHTIQTIREWFTVKDEDIDTSDPGVFTYLADVLGGRHQELQKVTNRLYQADVNLWVERWLWEAEKLPSKNRKVLVDDASTSQPIMPPPNGALWHRQRLAKLRTCKEEKDRRTAERKRIEQLDAIANKTPIDYESDNDALIAVEEKWIYSAFATQMRQNGFNESDVFDALQALSELVRQSRQFLPKLTAPVVHQFEARVLLSYCVRNRQIRESAAAAAKKDDAEYDCRKYVAKIYLQLLQFWINPPRSRPSTEVDWADAVGKALQEAAKLILVR